MSRTINTITINVARDSVGTVNLNQYIDRLITACYDRPGVVVETEIDVNPADATSYEGCINGDLANPTALSDELKTVAEELLASMKAGKGRK